MMRSQGYYPVVHRKLLLRRLKAVSAADVEPSPFVDAGGPYTTTNGIPVALAGTASNVDSVQWISSGDGIFDDDTSLTAVYTPGAADRTAGAGQNVTLTLRGIVDDEPVVTDDANLGVTITGTDTRRVENDAGTYASSVWSDADGAIYPGPPGGNAEAGRVRFTTHASGDEPPAGAVYTSAALRMTLGTGDMQTYVFKISAFTKVGTLDAVLTLETLVNSENVLDDLSEKTINLPLPTSWDPAHPNRNGLQFECAAPNQAVVACSQLAVSIDMYADMEWSKAPP